MLGVLTDKMQSLLSKIAGKKKLTEDNISEAVSEVRMALLEADVNYGVAKTLVKRVKEKALGDEVIKSVSPGQQFIKIVHDELVALMGEGEAPLHLAEKPAVVMLCGLQGAGKTTHCAKLAKYLKKKGECKKILLAACDLQRPAAIEQLVTLGQQINVPVFVLPGEKDPVRVAKEALAMAKAQEYDVLIVDTAGRLHIDDELMQQLERVKAVLNPAEVLFVANATTGQDAVTTAAEFHKRIAITGSILTMLDGNARGGAAISIREITGMPLKFEGIGEKLDDIQLFSPTSMADRILGMGDTINLVKKAQEHIDEDQAKDLEKKMRSATFTYEDYLSQIQMVKKMGSIKSLLSMLPGVGSSLKSMDFDDKEFFKVEAIIQSMTPNERAEKCELSVPRRKRVADGSGTSMEAVNKLIKSFKQAKQFFKKYAEYENFRKDDGRIPMALKIRLRQQGRTNRPFYRLVLTDVRAPRDGKYIEALGWYNPFEAELDKSIFLDAARVQHWLSMGAQFSDSAESLVAKVAPSVVNANIAKDVASRAKAAAKRKARKKAAA